MGSEIEVERDKGYQRRPPPAAPRTVVAVRAPGPIIIVVDPAAIVIRRPAPGLVTNPRPAVRRNPNPLTIPIRRPVVVVVDDRDLRSPDPAVIVCIGPTAIRIEIFPAPDIIVQVAHVVVILQPRGQITFAIVDPVVPVVF